MTDKQMTIKLMEKLSLDQVWTGVSRRDQPKATQMLTVEADGSALEWLFDKDGQLLSLEVI